MDRFDLDTAYWLARAARAAYPDRRDTSPGQLGIERVRVFEQGVVAGFAGCWGDSIVVAFQGTPTPNKGGQPLDFAEAVGISLDCVLTPQQDVPGMIHRGFARALSTLNTLMSELLCNLSDTRDRPRIWLTGHSLGGAMAVLAAQSVSDQPGPLPCVYTYGAPRVGNRTFTQGYTPTHYRLERRKDLVPHALPLYTTGLPWPLLPPPFFFGLPGRYKHTGIRCCIDGDRLKIGVPFESLTDPLNTATSRLGKEHNIDTYLADLEKKPRIIYSKPQE